MTHHAAPRESRLLSRRATGFTMTELVMVIVILGILAAVAVPRFSTAEYRAIDFHDRVIAALRYAQKTAVSHRRLVCVSFPTTASISFKIAQLQSAANCTSNASDLLIPGANSATVASSDVTTANFASGATAFNFKANGTAWKVDGSAMVNGEIAITNASPNILIVGTTGYVGNKP